MKTIKDNIDVNRDGDRVVVTRTIKEEYEVEELKKLVEDMEKNLERLEQQIESLDKERKRLKELLNFWKNKIGK